MYVLFLEIWTKLVVSLEGPTMARLRSLLNMAQRRWQSVRQRKSA
jgi:hypothetical protein